MTALTAPMIQTFAALLLAHALADFILQPRWIRFNKHRADSPRWMIGLSLHGLIHGAFVAGITGWLGSCGLASGSGAAAGSEDGSVGGGGVGTAAAFGAASVLALRGAGVADGLAFGRFAR